MDINVENLDREELVELVKRLLERIKALEAYVVEQDAEIQQLRQQLGQKKPPWVKSNRPKSEGPKKSRKKRAAEHNHGRHREKPTRTEQHALERCPDCGYRLQGKSIDYSRQVIELPPPRPVEVIEHQVIKRYCPHCQGYKSPKLDLEGEVLGQGRMGVRLASLVAYLRQRLRLPIRSIQEYLKTIHQLSISIGEIVELLHDVRQATEGALNTLKEEMKDQPCGARGRDWLAGERSEWIHMVVFDAGRGSDPLLRVRCQSGTGGAQTDPGGRLQGPPSE